MSKLSASGYGLFFLFFCECKFYDYFGKNANKAPCVMAIKQFYFRVKRGQVHELAKKSLLANIKGELSLHHQNVSNVAIFEWWLSCILV